MSIRRAFGRNNRWMTTGTATAIPAARKPGWMKPKPFIVVRSPGYGSVHGRASGQVVQEGPIERHVRCQRHQVDTSAAGSLIELGEPRRDRACISRSNLVHMR